MEVKKSESKTEERLGSIDKGRVVGHLDSKQHHGHHAESEIVNKEGDSKEEKNT